MFFFRMKVCLHSLLSSERKASKELPTENEGAWKAGKEADYTYGGFALVEKHRGSLDPLTRGQMLVSASVLRMP